jgi:hypothetical protein
VLAMPNVIMNNTQLRGLVVAGSDATGRKACTATCEVLPGWSSYLHWLPCRGSMLRGSIVYDYAYDGGKFSDECLRRMDGDQGTWESELERMTPVKSEPNNARLRSGPHQPSCDSSIARAVIFVPDDGVLRYSSFS